MKRPACKEIQKWLFQYLSTDVDPYDFSFAIGPWADEYDVRPGVDLFDATFEDLNPHEQKAFTAWLRDEIPRLVEQDPAGVPAYLMLHAETKPPRGTWFVHFTNSSAFKSFEQGTTLEGLHLSMWKKTKAVAQCPHNLSQDIGTYEVVFGFAFLAEKLRHYREYQKKYGRNAVLFQCDCAVVAYHDGDEEHQAIFPLCSEYNVLPLTGNEGGFTAEDDDGNEVEFANLDAVITYVERAESQGFGGRGYPKLRRLR